MPGKTATKPVAKLVTRSAWPLLVETALRGYLGPRLAADAEIDLKPVVAALGAPKRLKNGQITGLKPDAFRVALDKALLPKGDKLTIAADADVADVQEVLSQLEDLAPEVADLVVSGGQGDDPPADTTAASPPGPSTDPTDEGANSMDPDADGQVENADPIAKVMEFLADKLSPEDMDQIKKMLEKKSDMAADKGVTKPAMDAAIAAALSAQRQSFAKVREAEIAVRPYVGQLQIGFDSADAVYEFALKKLGAKTDGVHPSAFPAILAAYQRPSAVRPKIASDSPASTAKPADKIDFGQSRIGLG